MQSYPGSFRLAAVMYCMYTEKRARSFGQLALTPLQLFDEFSLALPTRGMYCTLFRTGRPVWYNKLVVLTEKRPGWDNPGLLVLLLLVQLASSYLSSASAIVFVLEIIA